MRRLRLSPLLIATLAASISAGLGAWKRSRSEGASAGPSLPRRTSPATEELVAPGGGSNPLAPPEAFPPPPLLSPAPSASLPGESSAAALLPVPGLLPTASAPALGEPEGIPAAMFRGDSRRRHRSGYRGAEKAPKIRYKIDLGGPIAAMPALFPNGDVVVASLSGQVFRVLPDGTKLWKAGLGARIYSSPLITEDLVVLGSDERRVVALSAETGKARWSLGVDGDGDTGAALGANGAILIAAGKVLYALRASGGIAWRFAAKKKIYAAPAVAEDGTTYVGSQDDFLYSISKHGSLLWRRDLGADIDCAATISEGGMIYVGTDGGQVVALDTKGSIRWRAEVSGFVRGGLTLTRDGAVLAGTYGPAPRVVALDAETGAERWSFRIQGTGAPEFGIHGAPLEDPAGDLYFGAQDDRIYALDRTGQLRWSLSTEDDVDAPLVIGPGGVLYAGSYDGHLYALR